MDFVKMHGLGNDFVLLDCLTEPPPRTDGEWAALAVQMCDRHFGVGADGILLALPSESADVRMRIFNGDGSEAEMCGNGVRCLARYARDRGQVKDRLRVETLAGVLELTFPGGPSDVRVDMGPPRLAPRDIPVRAAGDRALDLAVRVDGRTFEVAAVSMGNPHAVAFMSAAELETLPLHEVARVHPGSGQVGDALLGPDQRQHLGIGIEFDPEALAIPVRDRHPQLPEAVVVGIAVVRRLLGRLLQCPHDVLGCGEVGVANPEADDVVSLRPLLGDAAVHLGKQIGGQLRDEPGALQRGRGPSRHCLLQAMSNE